MDKQIKVGDWVWHKHRVSVAQVKFFGETREDGRQYVAVTFSSFGMSNYAVYDADTDTVRETFVDCLVPLEQAPCYVSELLADWVDAIAMDKARLKVGETVRITVQGMHAGKVGKVVENDANHYVGIGVAGLFSDATIAYFSADEVERAIINDAVYAVGDTVRIKAHPGYVGVVRFINVYRGETTYSVEFEAKGYSPVIADAQGHELERVPFGWDKV